MERRNGKILFLDEEDTSKARARQDFGILDVPLVERKVSRWVLTKSTAFLEVEMQLLKTFVI